VTRSKREGAGPLTEY